MAAKLRFMAIFQRRRRLVVPSSFMVARRPWRVFIEPQTSAYRVKEAHGKPLHRDPDGGPYAGMTYFDPREIHLSKKLNQLDLQKIFIHEILHVAIGESDRPLAAKREEELVQHMTPRLFEMLRQFRWEDE